VDHDSAPPDTRRPVPPPHDDPLHGCLLYLGMLAVVLYIVGAVYLSPSQLAAWAVPPIWLLQVQPAGGDPVTVTTFVSQDDCESSRDTRMREALGDKQPVYPFVCRKKPQSFGAKFCAGIASLYRWKY
jgi:hypothetical protein